MIEGVKDDTGSAPPSPAKAAPKSTMVLNNFDDEERENVANRSDDENDQDEEEELIQGLSNFRIDNRQPDEEYISKGPVFRRNEVSHRAAPYQTDPTKQQPTSPPADTILDQFDMSLLDGAQKGDKKDDKIPCLPDIDVSIPTEEKIVQNMDPYYNNKDLIVEPRLLLRTKSNGYHILTTKVFISINTDLKKLGTQLPKIAVPEEATLMEGGIEILLQPNSREKRVLQGLATVTESTDEAGKKCTFVEEQFLELAPFILKGMSATEKLLEGVSKEDIDAAVALVNRQDPQDLFKTYGPNNDSMLMTLCCKKDDTPTIRAQVFALTARILSMTELKLRRNIVMKNGSGLSALDYTSVTNNARIAVFLSQLFFALGQDIFGRDSSGNTIIHVMARKGDSVAQTLETLLTLRFRHGSGGKIYNGNVINGKNFLPIHIAAMSSTCPQNTIRILRQDFEQSLYMRTSDGSLPLHMACQYTSDPNLLAALINCNKNSTVNERRNDGFTPLHLVAARNDEKDSKLGLIPLDEASQIHMIQLLLEHGANRNLTVENYKPVDLLKPTRVQAMSIFRMNNFGGRKPELRIMPQMVEPNSPNQMGSVSSPGQMSGGDHSPVMSHPSPSALGQDPFIGNGFYSSDSEASPNMMNHWQSSPYVNHYSPYGHNGSVSSGVESHFSGASDESDEDNNSGAELDAIAQVLIAHPTIQAAIEAATNLN